MCSAPQAGRKGATLAWLTLACALTTLALAMPAAAAASWSSLAGWAQAGSQRASASPHAGKRCHGHCCRRRQAGRRTACVKRLSAPGPALQSAPAAPAQPGAPAPVVTAAGDPEDTPAAAAPDGPGPTEEPSPEQAAEPELPPDDGGTDGDLPPADEPSSGNPPAAEAPATGPESTPPATAAPAQLAWAPPRLVNPKTIVLGNGFTHTSLSTSRDYIVELPPTRKVGGTWLDGGHNVVLIGGAVTIPTGTDPGAKNDAQRRAIYIRGATGTVHIEGVRIDGSGGGEMDGVDIAAPEATVQLENLRIEGIRGGYSSFHADLVQPWGGVGDLRIDRLSGTSNYQGLFLKRDLGPIGSVEISNTDLQATAEAPIDRGGTMLWLTSSATSCASFPLSLSNVFISPRPGSTLERAVWPSTGSSLGCEARGASVASWPSLPVSGSVREGAPAAGSFVPPAVAGVDYRSPGYASP